MRTYVFHRHNNVGIIIVIVSFLNAKHEPWRQREDCKENRTGRLFVYATKKIINKILSTKKKKHTRATRISSEQLFNGFSTF